MIARCAIGLSQSIYSWLCIARFHYVIIRRWLRVARDSLIELNKWPERWTRKQLFKELPSLELVQ